MTNKIVGRVGGKKRIQYLSPIYPQHISSDPGTVPRYIVPQSHSPAETPDCYSRYTNTVKHCRITETTVAICTHHQPGTQGTPGEDCMPMHAGNYKIYSGHGQGSGSGGTADTRGYPASTGEYKYHLGTGEYQHAVSHLPASRSPELDLRY